jgi:predicted acylesterase/phospholipase RssA
VEGAIPPTVADEGVNGQPLSKHPPYCDLIMKGGITSGVVYPLAVAELAKQYQFKSIGGASAGAIAAAGTAAAEYGRRNGAADTFERLAGVATTIASQGRLVSLFEPTAKARPAFKVIISILSAKGRGRKFLAAAKSLPASFPVSALVGLGGAIIVPLILSYWRVASTAESLLLGFIWFMFGIAALLLRFGSTVVGAFAEEGFGLCTGFNPSPQADRPPLTNWLSDLLNSLAGKPSGQPLTFGDLWTASQEADQLKTPKAIDLQLMTTNLTHGRPYVLPFPPRQVVSHGQIIELDRPTFYFDKKRWDNLFPKEVIDWMVEKQIPFEPVDGGVTSDGVPTVYASNVEAVAGEQLIPLPRMADLPVIVAARMSLSYPGLIAAIPLHTIDYSLQENQDKASKGEPVKAEICWFSDGGISSNFPIHLFDSPLPRWPTFGINLRPPHIEHQKEEDLVWLPPNNLAGIQEQWSRFDSGTNLTKTVGFAQAILNVLQNWRDNMQMTVPGYRDRIVHISLGPEEGGLNLNMAPETIRVLTDRGSRAGQKLLDEFNFANHAWIRYRSTMASLEAFLSAFNESFTKPLPEDVPLWEIIKGTSQAKPPSYVLREPERSFARVATEGLAALNGSWVAVEPYGLAAGAPQLQPVLRITPHA